VVPYGRKLVRPATPTETNIAKATHGKLVGDETLEAKGNIQKNIGKVQEKVGDLKQGVKDSLK
jgi:uncharacterized protein YjbJ (UPF0337 family)